MSLMHHVTAESRLESISTKTGGTVTEIHGPERMKPLKAVVIPRLFFLAALSSQMYPKLSKLNILTSSSEFFVFSANVANVGLLSQ